MMRRCVAFFTCLAMFAGLLACNPSDSTASMPEASSASLQTPQSAEQAQTKGETKDSARQLERLQEQMLKQYRNKDYDRCIATLEKILDLDEHDAAAWYNLACVKALQGKKAGALRALERAVKEGYTDYRKIAADDDLRILRNHKRFQRALDAARKAQMAEKRSDPDVQEALREAREIARINQELYKLFMDKKYQQCTKLLDKILQIDPNNATAHYNYACTYARMGKQDEALESLNRSLDHGYSDFRHMQRDPDLETLRDRKEYKAILQRQDEIQRTRAERIAKQLEERFGEDYLYEISHDDKLVIATNTDRKTLDEMTEYLTAVANAQWRDLFTHKFDQYVTIVIPKEGTFRNRRMGGYYQHARRMLVSRGLGMELTHEFTHALHGADLSGLGQQHPIWVMEGLATLFETSKLIDGHLVPQPNRRLNQLQHLVRRKRTIDWEKFFGFDQKQFMQAQYKSGISYSQARYVLMYLYDQGLLKKWYDAYTEGFDEDPTGAQAMEKVFGKDLGKIEAQWRTWVVKQKAPPLRLKANQGYMGVATRQVPDGLAISMVVPKSGAHKAGLRPGDVIIRVGDERVFNSHDLLQLVSEYEVDDELEVEYRRDGKYDKTTVTLQPKPARIRRPHSPEKNRRQAEDKGDRPDDQADEKPQEDSDDKQEKKKAA